MIEYQNIAYISENWYFCIYTTKKYCRVFLRTLWHSKPHKLSYFFLHFICSKEILIEKEFRLEKEIVLNSFNGTQRWHFHFFPLFLTLQQTKQQKIKNNKNRFAVKRNRKKSTEKGGNNNIKKHIQYRVYKNFTSRKNQITLFE